MAVCGLLCLICLIFPLKLLKCETLVEFQTRVFRQNENGTLHIQCQYSSLILKTLFLNQEHLRQRLS